MGREPEVHQAFQMSILLRKVGVVSAFGAMTGKHVQQSDAM